MTHIFSHVPDHFLQASALSSSINSSITLLLILYRLSDFYSMLSVDESSDGFGQTMLPLTISHALLAEPIRQGGQWHDHFLCPIVKHCWEVVLALRLFCPFKLGFLPFHLHGIDSYNHTCVLKPIQNSIFS